MKNLRRYHNTDILFKSLTQDIKEKMDLDLNSLFYLAISGGNKDVRLLDKQESYTYIMGTDTVLLG